MVEEKLEVGDKLTEVHSQIKQEREHIKEILQVEKAFEEQMSKSDRVEKDDLEDLNLGFVQDPKMVKVSVKIEGEFKGNLTKLLKEFTDIFALSYTHMKGVDPKFSIEVKKQVKDEENLVEVECYVGKRTRMQEQHQNMEMFDVEKVRNKNKRWLEA